MKVELPYEVVKDRVEKFLKHFVDESGVVKALSKYLNEFPSNHPVAFIYHENEGTIVYGCSTIDVHGKKNVDKLLRWIFYEEEEAQTQKG